MRFSFGFGAVEVFGVLALWRSAESLVREWTKEEAVERWSFGAMAATNVSLSAGIISSFSSLKKESIPGSLQQAMVVELRGARKVQRSRASRGQRVRVAGVRNAAPELVEMEPASQGSQLLGDNLWLFYCNRFGFCSSHCCANAYWN